jgi:hypothetical protein
MRFAIVSVLALLPLVAQAQHAPHRHGAPYSGMERREIKSLSNEDQADLRRGAGWGLALPAELNGHPGPLHVLELKAELALSEQQVEAITPILERMRRDAIAEGERFIAAERVVEVLFRERKVDEAALRTAISASEASRAKLRMIHLLAHLSTPALLTEAQIVRYKQLRGYGSDPCTAVPAGHDPSMWRRHNGCGG